MPELSKGALAAAREWNKLTQDDSTMSRMDSDEEYETQLAAIIDKHMNPLNAISAADELRSLFLNEWARRSSDELMQMTVAIVERTGRKVSDG